MFRIMVAEDEPLILQSICEKIRASDKDFKIVGEYENGEYALLELDVVKPHVLLTDIYMPVMDGLTLIEHVQSHSPSTICAVLTGYRDFEYARKAIQLGVSDYLLKPPSAENIAKFLTDVKEKLTRNQALVEAELLQQWAYHKENGNVYSPELQQLAQEYFYHACYIVIYIWMPPQMSHAAYRLGEARDFDEHLHAGEKAYFVPSASSHQRMIVVGVHGRSDSRPQRLAELAASLLEADACCVTAATIGKLQTELFAAAQKLHKVAYSRFPLQGAQALAWHSREPAYEVPMLPIPGGLEQELSSLLFKQRKTEFVKKLELLLHGEAWFSASRLQWLQSLSYLMNTWTTQNAELARRIVGIRWSDELEDAIWQATDANALIQHVKELHASLFDALEQEKEIEASWVDELKSYLETRYMDNIALTDIADRTGLNASYVGRVFKRKYGHSPIDYLIQIRLAKAKQLIREKPRLLFKDVAEMVGYTDPFYFSKLFKQWTGQTPREFKKSQADE